MEINWIKVSDRLPPVAEGDEGRFLVTLESYETGKRFAFEAHYLNAMLVNSWDGDGGVFPNVVIEKIDDDEDDSAKVTGWLDFNEERDERCYLTITHGKITHWAEYPAPAPV